MDRVKQAAAGVNGAFAIPSESTALSAQGGTRRLKLEVERQRSFPMRALRVLRNAALAVAVLLAVPVTLVGVFGNGPWLWTNSMSYVRVRANASETAREFMLERDPAITARQAGRAFAVIAPPRQAPSGFLPADVRTPIERPWVSSPITSDMFPDAHPNLSPAPDVVGIIRAAHRRQFTASELRYLNAVKDAKAWEYVNTVARARDMDIIGGAFVLPLGGENRQPWDLPNPSYRQVRELSYAAASRAAAFMAAGQVDSAEAALRTVISLGFALVDHGNNSLDILIGSGIIYTGRLELATFYEEMNDPRAKRIVPPASPKWQPEPRGKAVSVDELRRQLMQRLSDKSLPRGARLEAARQLSMSSCTNVRELMFGQRQEVSDALVAARRELSRYPSDLAYFDLVTKMPHLGANEMNRVDPVTYLAVSAASIPGIVLHNPRLTTCTALTVGSVPALNR